MTKLHNLIKEQCEAWDCWNKMSDSEKEDVKAGYMACIEAGANTVIDLLKNRKPDLSKKENVFMRGEQAAKWAEDKFKIVMEQL